MNLHMFFFIAKLCFRTKYINRNMFFMLHLYTIQYVQIWTETYAYMFELIFNILKNLEVSQRF
jgi:hypothetical protein